jgi:hypothetical protein
VARYGEKGVTISKKRLNSEKIEELAKETNTVAKTTYLTNAFINIRLTEMRNDLRSGEQRIGFAHRGAEALPGLVAAYLDMGENGFDKSKINPQTLSRFNQLFAMEGVTLWPSPDRVATALQNFMNRRKDIWKTKGTTGTAETQASV